MKNVYITITGMKYRYGTECIEAGTKVRLVKEPDNEYDREAIRVELEGAGLIGYVANSVYTVKGESISAGRLYDRIGSKAKAKVVCLLPNAAIAKVSKKSLLWEPTEPFIEIPGDEIPDDALPAEARPTEPVDCRGLPED